MNIDLKKKRVYKVLWPKSLWYLDGHHSLIRWKLVIQGKLCICSVILVIWREQFLILDTVRKDADRWPSRVRVDRGVENVLVCDAMVQFRGVRQFHSRLIYPQ